MSFFEGVVETPEDIQDLILRIFIYDGYGTDCFCGEKHPQDKNWVFHKSKLYTYLKMVFPRFKHYRNGNPKDQSDGQILRQVNNLIKQRVLEVVDIKRKKCIIRGTMWDSRVKKINKMISECSDDALLVKILMGDNPELRKRYIQENCGQAKFIDT